MKTIIVIVDGAADLPDESFGGLTPLQAADMPVAADIAAMSVTGRLVTSPDGSPPGSETAIMSILGYGNDVPIKGRAWFEALGLEMPLHPGSTVWRCNVVRSDDEGRVTDPMPADIDDARARFLIESSVSFPIIKDARHIKDLSGLVVTDSSYSDDDYISPYDAFLSCEDGRPFTGLPHWMWLWSPGNVISLRPCPYRGAVIAATPLVRGIGRALGMKVSHSESMTGDCITSLEAKADTAVSAIDDPDTDLVVVHVEGADTASHAGRPDMKKAFLEQIDSRLLAPVWNRARTGGVALVLLPDHVTSWHRRRHTSDPVPVCVYIPGMPGDSVRRFDEISVSEGSLGLIPSCSLPRILDDLRKCQKYVH